MKRLFGCGLCLFVVLSVVSCSKGPVDVLESMKSYQGSGDMEGIKKCYTKGTVKAMEEMEKYAPKSKDDKGKVDKRFARDSEWKVVSEKIDGDTAELKIQFVEHPVENMKGLEIPFKMKKEDGEWKIDMEKEMNMSLKMIKQMGGKSDFMRRMKMFNR